MLSDTTIFSQIQPNMKNEPLFKVTVGEKIIELPAQAAQDLDVVKSPDGNWHVLSAGKAFQIEMVSEDQRSKTFSFKINGALYTAKIADKYDRLIDQLGMKTATAQRINAIRAPMPGLVLEVAVSIGQVLAKGDKVLILEAMKMENVLKAAGEGTVKAIHVQKGSAVEKGTLLIELT
jgi:biotin carboxyl carrier protein